MKQSVVYCQLQNNLPSCFKTSLRKARELWKGDIFVIAPQRECHYEYMKEYGVIPIYREKLKSPLIEAYERDTFLISMYPNWDGFWDNACRRFPYMEVLMREHGIGQMLHLETDVVPYIDIEKMFGTMGALYGHKIAFTPHMDEQLNCGATYCGSPTTMTTFCENINDYFRRGADWFKVKYPKHSIVNETNFAYTFWKEHPELVGIFPALPEDENAATLGFLIDPDGWGRWVDGVRYSPGTRYAAPIHYIGAKILDGTYDILFSYEGRKIKTPYAYNTITGKSFPIATLHFNSKEPECWT